MLDRIIAPSAFGAMYLSLGGRVTFDQRVRLLSLSGLRDVLPAFVISRLLIVFVMLTASWWIHSFQLQAPLPAHYPTSFDAHWFQWDSVWYLRIATAGYGAVHPVDTTFAFFPLYPVLVRLLLGAWPGTPVDAGLLVANLCSLAAFAVVYRLVCLEYGRACAVRTLWVFAFVPTSLYLSAGYSEGLFLLCVSLCLLLARHGYWGWAGVTGALALATHATGVIVIGPLLTLYYQRFLNTLRPRFVGTTVLIRSSLGDRLATALSNPAARRAFYGIALVPAGLLGYMLYLGVRFGDPLLFRASETFNWHRGLSWPWQTLYLQISFMLEHPPALNVASILSYQDTITLVVTLVVSVLATRTLPRYLAALIWFFWLVVLCTPIQYQNFYDPLQSLCRYVLPIFPLWIYLAATPRRTWIACLVSLPVLIANAALFLSGSWVA